MWLSCVYAKRTTRWNRSRRLERFSRRFAAPVFKEFVIRDHQDAVSELVQQALEAGILAGIPLAKWYPELDDCLLVTVTEKRTADDIQRLTAALATAAVTTW